MFKIPTNKTRADKHEKTVAKRLGGKITKGSGNGRDKADINTPEMKVECKTTKAESYRLDRLTLAKIETQAKSQGKIGVMNIQFEGTNARYVVILERDFEMLTGLGV